MQLNLAQDIVMQSASIPFYLNKPTGSGLGLALCRDITDAYYGYFALNNRKSDWLIVQVY